jgi:hypothetical protein
MLLKNGCMTQKRAVAHWSQLICDTASRFTAMGWSGPRTASCVKGFSSLLIEQRGGFIFFVRIKLRLRITGDYLEGCPLIPKGIGLFRKNGVRPRTT